MALLEPPREGERKEGREELGSRSPVAQNFSSVYRWKIKKKKKKFLLKEKKSKSFI